MTASTRDPFWDAIPSVAASMNVARWLRPTVIRSFVSARILIVFAAILVSYALQYMYYRLMLAQIEACLSVAEFAHF